VKTKLNIIILLFLLAACSGTKKYFKAAEKLEKQGLVNEAAEFYLESLQRKPTNVDARIKLKDVGQKYVSFLCSEFFRTYNTGQLETSIDDFEKMKDFNSRCEVQNVQLNYPSAYEDDYKSAIEKYCEKNYDIGADLVKQKKYTESLVYLNNVNKYKPEFKKTKELKITATCEPIYQVAITQMEGKNYLLALNNLNTIHTNTESYKDSRALSELCMNEATKDLLLFQPKNSAYPNITDFLFNSFSQTVVQNFKTMNVINNSPFVFLPGNDIENNVDLIQGIRKASGADFFYVFNVTNKSTQVSGPQKTLSKCFQRFTFKGNNGIFMTDYKATDYYEVRSKRTFSYSFNYKLVNALTNQIVTFQTVTVSKVDEVDYNEFAYAPAGNLNDYTPYNPLTVGLLNQYNPTAWRNLFTANKTLKTEQELETSVNQETIKLFSQTLSNYVK